MAPRKNAKGGGGSSSSSGSGSGSTSTGSSSPGARRETKHGGHKNGRKGGLSGSSFFTWFMVIALLGVWTSVAVVWFDLVDYEEVLGKLGVYDADGDGDFDVDDAKVLLEGPGGVAKRKTKAKVKEPSKAELKKEKEKLVSRKESKNEERKKGKKEKETDRKDKKTADSGLKERAASEPNFPPPEAEPHTEPEDQVPLGTEPQNIEDEVKEQIQSILHEMVHTEHGEDLQQEEEGPAGELQLEEDDFLTTSDVDDRYEILEPETLHEDTEDTYHVEETVSQDHHQDMEEIMYDQENSDSSEPLIDEERLHQEADDVTYHDYDEQDNAIEDSNLISEEVNATPVEEHQEIPPDT